MGTVPEGAPGTGAIQARPMKRLFWKALLRLAWWSAAARAACVVSGSMRSVQ
jgi:hypothetical protein